MKISLPGNVLAHIDPETREFYAHLRYDPAANTTTGTQNNADNIDLLAVLLGVSRTLKKNAANAEGDAQTKLKKSLGEVAAAIGELERLTNKDAARYLLEALSKLRKKGHADSAIVGAFFDCYKRHGVTDKQKLWDCLKKKLPASPAAKARVRTR